MPGRLAFVKQKNPILNRGWFTHWAGPLECTPFVVSGHQDSPSELAWLIKEVLSVRIPCGSRLCHITALSEIWPELFVFRAFGAGF